MGASIKDVARLAGVSPATVSRVFGDGPVSEALRAKVEAAIRATGYRPNLYARRLRSQDSSTIGLIVADIRNPFFTAVSRAVEDVAYREGLRVILANTDEKPDKEDIYLKLMEEERVSGVILAPTRTTVERLEGGSLPYPSVLIDRAPSRGGFDAVALDNVPAAGVLVEHLHANGYRRIAGFFGETSTTGLERHAGYLAAMARLGLVPDATFLPPTTEAAEAAFARRFSAERPEAIIVSSGLLLMGVARGARAAGLSIPEDVALAGFDNEPWTELVGGGLTVIEQPVDAIGRAAMAMLFERMEKPEAPRRKLVLAGRLVVRGSTAQKSGRRGRA